MPLKVRAVPRELLCIIRVLVALFKVKEPLLVRVLPMVKVEVAVAPVNFKVPAALIVVVPVTVKSQELVSKTDVPEVVPVIVVVPVTVVVPPRFTVSANALAAVGLIIKSPPTVIAPEPKV